MRAVKRCLWIMLMILPACTPTGPDTGGFEAAAGVANDVEGGHLMPLVRQLAAAHERDTPLSNDGFTPEEDFPSDHLTRDSAVALVASEFSAMGYLPTTVVLGEGVHATYNVVAEWPGMSHKNEVVLVGCHLDAFYSGADDNGSAVAAVLETARAVRMHRFARTIRFVAFDLEEFGSIGSTRYIQAGFADDVVQAIVLDMVGYASSEPGSQKDVLGIRLPETGDFLIVAGNQNSAEMVQQIAAMSSSMGLAKVQGVLAPGDGTYFLSTVFMRSDHGLLWFRGIPAVFFTDGAGFRNPHYHKASDTPETLDPQFLERNTRVLAAAVALFAEVQP
jgi:Zn-dependent M28 family amino/carboxypeptidase